jgi:hypothetical protein
MTPRLLKVMKEHFASYRFASYGGVRPIHVFHHTETRAKNVGGRRIKSMRGGWNFACERAEVSGVRQHDLRHRRITTWLADGKNPVHVKEAVGHADLQTTMGYTHLAKEHLRSLVEDRTGVVHLRGAREAPPGRAPGGGRRLRSPSSTKTDKRVGASRGVGPLVVGRQGWFRADVGQDVGQDPIEPVSPPPPPLS